MNVWWTAFIWVALALAASVVSIRLALSVALAEILFGVLAGNLLHIQPNEWINFLAGLGGVLLTFLAGAETDWRVLCSEWRGAFALGMLSFLAALVAEVAVVRWIIGGHGVPRSLRVWHWRLPPLPSYTPCWWIPV